MTEPDPGRFAGPSVSGPQMPEPPDDVRAAAREAPEHWLTVVDPDWDIDAPPPVWALVGQWRTDGDGEVVEWVANPEHRPGPRTLGWPDPTDPVDAVLQRVATGYAPAELLFAALRDAELWTVDDASGAAVRAAAPDGAAVIPVYSSRTQLAGVGAMAHSARSLTELVMGLPPGHDLYLNPAGMAPIVLDTGSLLLPGGAVNAT